VVSRVLPCLLALTACDQGAPPSVTVRDDAAPAPLPVDAAVPDAPLDAPVDAPPPSYRGLTFRTEESCIWLTVGPAREKASVCTEVDENLWRVTRRVMRVVRNGKRTNILDVRAKIEGFDTGHNALESRLSIATDGLSVIVESIPAGSLAPRRRPHRRPEPTEDCRTATERDDYVVAIPDSGPSYGTVRDRQCADLGTYVWNGDRFARDR